MPSVTLGKSLGKTWGCEKLADLGVVHEDDECLDREQIRYGADRFSAALRLHKFTQFAEKLTASDAVRGQNHLSRQDRDDRGAIMEPTKLPVAPRDLSVGIAAGVTGPV